MDTQEQAKHVQVVYVEDEPFFAGTMSRLLIEAGYTTALADDGEKGVALIQKEKPDLVLLDLVLPKLDGKEVLRRIKADPETKDIPVIVLSNLSAEGDQREAEALGAVGFFVKALTLPSVVVEEVRKRLPQKS
jgi:CheY-like chemotaxis protein